jgi:hypothetical protein
MAIVGYARVSTQGQSLTGQIETLKGAGAATIYQEKVSGAMEGHTGGRLATAGARQVDVEGDGGGSSRESDVCRSLSSKCLIKNQEASMPVLSNPRHEAFAQALARGLPATAAYVEAGYKANAGNACTLKSQQNISKRVVELQEEQLAIHQQATAAAALSAQVTIESLIAEAEAARAKAMSEKGGAAAAVSALTAKAKLAGMWREKVDQHNTGAVYERIERVIVERTDEEATNSSDFAAEANLGEVTNGQKHWWAD